MDNIKVFYSKILGKGSFSNVYKGIYKNTDVAVKIINTENLDGKIRQQMQREIDVINILKKNKNKNIVEYYDIYEENDELFIAMELINGGELSLEIKKGLELSQVYDYYCQILGGYSHLLSLDIIHRDIKSANILLSEDKKYIKICDFGLSKILGDNLNNTICGSPLCMSPELLNQQNYDTKSDIWSIGILLYEMIYGFTPYHKSSGLKTLKKNVFTKEIEYKKNSYLDKYDVSQNLISYLKKLLELNQYKRIEWDNLHDIDWFENNKEYVNIQNLKEFPNISDTISSIMCSKPMDIKNNITDKDIRDDINLSDSINSLKNSPQIKSAPITFSSVFTNVKNIVKNIISL